MPDLQDDIRSHLMEQTNLRDLIGAEIYPDVLDSEATLPAIVVRFIDQVPHATLDTNASTSATSRIQLDVYALKSSSARKIANLIRESNFEAYRGHMGESWVDECFCDQSLRTREDPPSSKGQNHRYIAEQDYLIQHQL